VVKCYNGIDLSVRLRIPYNLCAFNLYQQAISDAVVGELFAELTLSLA
jgi:hypothetical protein